MLVLLYILFCLLSPGLLLLPPLSPYEAVQRGLSYGSSPVSCIDQGLWAPECSNGIFMQFRTTSRAVTVHTILFYFFLRIFEINNAFNLSVWFLLLSPGLLLTFPPLTKANCADTAENGQYCPEVTSPGSACLQCQSWFLSKSTSFSRILIHGLVYCTIVYLTSNV